MNNYKIIKNCLLCNGNICKIISFGETPLANEFLDKPQKQDTFPLNLVQCIDCNHVQIDCIVDQERLFKNYIYVSGTNKTNVAHFEEYAKDIMIDHLDWMPFKNEPGMPIMGRLDHVNNYLLLDIGSNDGTFLKSFMKHSIKVIGIDPAANLKEIALKNGIETITDFFNEETATNIKNNVLNGKTLKVITCNNMFAHNSNLDTIILGVLNLLDKDGIFVFENSYLLDILDKTLVDLIYHEHMHHHHITALQKFFDKYEMDIYDVKRLPNHGGSVRVFVCRRGARSIRQSVFNILKEEQSIPLKIEKFCENFQLLKKMINERLLSLKEENKDIIIFGFPAKATTLMYSFDIDEKLISYGIDDAKLKQGKFSPGKHIQIFGNEALTDGSVVLILAWNFADSIMENNRNFMGTWLVPLPELKEYHT